MTKKQVFEKVARVFDEATKDNVQKLQGICLQIHLACLKTSGLAIDCYIELHNHRPSETRRRQGIFWWDFDLRSAKKRAALCRRIATSL